LYSYVAEFIQKLLHGKKKSLAVAFNSTFRWQTTMFYLLTTINFTHMSIRYIAMSWKSKTSQSAPHLLRI
jgi:hypothetical protein